MGGTLLQKPGSKAPAIYPRDEEPPRLEGAGEGKRSERRRRLCSNRARGDDQQAFPHLVRSQRIQKEEQIERTRQRQNALQGFEALWRMNHAVRSKRLMRELI